MSVRERQAADSLASDTLQAPHAARRWAALSGLIAMGAFLASAEIVALVTGASGSPLFAVGSSVIDLAPKGAKQVMVSLFGTGDKAALFVLMGLVLVVVTALAGLLEWRRAPLGRTLFGVGTLAAVLAAVTRSDNSLLAAVPSLVGGFVAQAVLRRLIARLYRWRSSGVVEEFPTTDTPPLASPGIERRALIRLAAITAGASLVLGGGARLINRTAVNAAALRAKVRLPRASVLEAAAPAGVSLDVAGITPYITANDDFYRIDTALQVPQVDPATWSLKITGMVDNPVEISFAELLAKPLVEHTATLSCVSNDVGGDLIGTAKWLGFPIRTLLAEARPHAGADMVLSRSIDGFTAGTPLDVLQDAGTQALLAVGMNGQPLPVQHGFPVRMVVPGLFGYVSATKWVVSMEVTTFAQSKAYWTTRGYTARGPVKLESRIDTPSGGASVAAGLVPIAGVAWEPHVGIRSVEVKIDGDPWKQARLADSISADTWRQWVYQWPASAGRHTITVRATSADGTVQSRAYVSPAPDGAEGWPSISVTVR